jgi:hypothetical protein
MILRKHPRLCVQSLALCLAAIGGYAQTNQTNWLVSMNTNLQDTNRYHAKSDAIRATSPRAQSSTNEDDTIHVMKETLNPTSTSEVSYADRLRKAGSAKRFGLAKGSIWQNVVQQFNPLGTLTPDELEAQNTSIWRGLPGGCPPPRFSTEQGFHDEGGLVIYAR